MSIKHYEVQTRTWTDGWINCWHDNDKPWTFASKADATRALDEFFIDLPEEMLTSYDIADYRVQPIYEAPARKLNHDFARCDNCGTEYDTSELDRVESLTERCFPGEEMPAGQCPDGNCGACCFLVEVIA
jgi:hypothetical protein